ncbi:MAG: hypothetical protein GKS06_08525 [Acidobacteria bacterium]|nr:hypothetical protein [Acidobacteriota bacterium]
MSERKFRHRERELSVRARRDGAALEATIDGETNTWSLIRTGAHEFVVRDANSAGPSRRVFAVRSAGVWWTHVDGRTYRFDAVLDDAGGDVASGGLTAPIPATVVEVLVEDGAEVEADAVLLVLSAMKMQLEIRAPHAGIVADLSLQAEDQVDGGQQLLTITAPESES